MAQRRALRDLLARLAEDATHPLPWCDRRAMINRPIGLRAAGGPIQARTEVIHAESLTSSVRAIRVAWPPGFDFRVSRRAAHPVDPVGDRLATHVGREHPDPRPILEFAARISDSAFKRALAFLRQGDAVRVPRAVGHHLSFDPHRPAVLVAGDIGITHLKSMIDYVTDLGLDTRSPSSAATTAPQRSPTGANSTTSSMPVPPLN